MFYQSKGDHARAEPLCRQALEVYKQTLGDQHPSYATTLSQLARAYGSRDDYIRAEPLHRQALDLRKQVLGEKHSEYAYSLQDMALLYEWMGDHARAEPLFLQALEIVKQALGERHPEYAVSLENVAWLHFYRRQPAQGEPFVRQALEIVRSHLERTAAVQSERQQLAMTENLRFRLDSYLSITAGAQVAGEQVYPEVLAWKGSVSARQQFIRAMRRALKEGEKPEVAKLYADLDQAARALAGLSRTAADPKKPDEHRLAMERLSEEIERLERALAAASVEFRQQLAQRRRTAEDIRKALPAETVLVDLLEYAHLSPPQDGKGKLNRDRRVAAFVVRPGQPVVRLDLGSAQPIAAAIDEWRKHFGLGQSAAERDPAVTLRRLVWEPLTPYLKGAKIVLLSPDGTTARFPWVALPGQQPGSYLIEEVALAVVPMPQQLPELLARPAGGDADPSLLVVGEVNFGALPAGVEPAPGGERGDRSWLPLPGTRAEVVAIKDSFQRRYRQATVTELREQEPTEGAFRQLASRHRYLHLATHGFFLPPRSSAAPAPAGAQPSDARGTDVTTQPPNTDLRLASGLVLAGANQPAAPGQDDGVLTALEVSALDLADVELATLSACETGLGESAGGEGVLGLQRAFQTAGARSVVASLWKVKDDAARSLMIDFYDNLWRKKLSRLEALRQAQLTMLREGIKRGLELEAGQQPDQRRRLPPYYWAAFVLSGDWR
jgi:CHAT domain-containing protein